MPTRCATPTRPVVAGDAEVLIDELRVGPRSREEGLDARPRRHAGGAGGRLAADPRAAGRPFGGRRPAPGGGGAAPRPRHPAGDMVRRLGRGRVRRVRAVQRRPRPAARPEPSAVRRPAGSCGRTPSGPTAASRPCAACRRRPSPGCAVGPRVDGRRGSSGPAGRPRRPRASGRPRASSAPASPRSSSAVRRRRCARSPPSSGRRPETVRSVRGKLRTVGRRASARRRARARHRGDRARTAQPVPASRPPLGGRPRVQRARARHRVRQVVRRDDGRPGRSLDACRHGAAEPHLRDRRRGPPPGGLLEQTSPTRSKARSAAAPESFASHPTRGAPHAQGRPAVLDQRRRQPLQRAARPVRALHRPAAS